MHGHCVVEVDSLGLFYCHRSTETQPPLQIKDPGMKNTAEAESKLLQIERQQEEQKLAKVTVRSRCISLWTLLIQCV